MAVIQRLKSVVKKYGIKYLWYLLLYKCGFVEADQISRCVEPYYLKLTQKERESELQRWFMQCMGYPLNLENPSTFSEKIQWMKLYDSTPRKTLLSDKYQVRNWISNEIGEEYLVPLLGVWDSFDKINFSDLPSKFVLKASHGSAMNIFIKNANEFNKKEGKKRIEEWLNTDFGINQTQQWHYLGIPHRILAEQYLETASGDLPDYKVYCFNGVPTYIQVITGRFSDECQVFLDVNWETMPFGHTGIKIMKNIPPKPPQLEEMLQLSEVLSKEFAFVRVDWYIVDNKKLYFSEMTFTPASGVRHWVPEGTDKFLGDLIHLPESKYYIN